MKKNRKRLKVLFLPKWYPAPAKPAYGIFIREHAKAVSLFNDVIVLYPESVAPDVNQHDKTESDAIEEGIRTIRTTRRKSKISGVDNLFYLFDAQRAIIKLLKENWRPDIIHAHIYSAGVIAVILGRIYKIPVVITEHWTGFPRKKLRLFNKLAARLAMNRSDIILPVSRNLEASIRSIGVKNRFAVIPNAADTSIFSPALEKRKTTKKKILFVGLLTPAKGIPFLLESIAEISNRRQDFTLDIVGEGPDRREYEELTKRLHLGGIITFHGIKTKSEIAGLMKHSDFFVLPSLWENLPCVLIEAAACGLPVVASRVGGVPEMVNEETGILFPAGDSNALMRSIDYMLDCFNNYSSEKIRNSALKKFSYYKVGKRIDEVYKELLYLRSAKG